MERPGPLIPYQSSWVWRETALVRSIAVAEPADRADPLAELLARAVAGNPPAPDGSVTVLRPGGRLAAVLAFAGHHVVVADVDPAWVHERLPHGDMSAPVAAGFLDDLGRQIGRHYDNLDLVLWAPGLPREPDPGLGLRAVPADDAHPRVARALRYRDEVRSWETADGAAVLVVARGLAGRWETSFEVDPQARSHGLGRRLVTAARHLVPAGEPLFLQVSPGNVASLRAVLAAGGFTPLGAEALFPPPAEPPAAP